MLDDVDDLKVTISIDTNADRFELSSMGEDAQKVTHSAGDAGATNGALGAPAAAAALGSSYAAVDVGVFYEAFRSVGLEYGPEFRALQALWANREAGVGVGRLRRRCNRFGTQVHPADLDGALQQTALIAEDTDAGETRLPFMVGEATLTSAKGRMCSIVERQGATSAGVWLAGLCKGDCAAGAPQLVREPRAQGVGGAGGDAAAAHVRHSVGGAGRPRRRPRPRALARPGQPRRLHWRGAWRLRRGRRGARRAASCLLCR